MSAIPSPAPPRYRLPFAGLVPGLLLTSAIAASAFAARALPGVAIFSPMILAIVVGIAFHNLVGTPARAKAAATTFLLSMALAAMGLETDIRKLRAKGLRPFLLGLAAFIFIASFSLMLVSISA